MCGTEGMILTLLRNLDRSRFTPTLVTLKGPGDLVRAAQNIGIDGYNLGLSRSQLITGFQDFRALVNKIQPNVIHSFLFHSNLLARAIKLFDRNIAVISGIRTVYTVKDYGRLYGFLERMTHSLDRFYVANSQHGLQSVIDDMRLPERKLIMIHNGLELNEPNESAASIRKDLDSEFGFDEKAIIIGIVAQLRPPKRHDLLIRAIARLKDCCPHARLLIIGQGYIEVDLKALAKEKDIEDRVVFAGYRNDVIRLLHGMDIFALASEVEGQPVSILEAMNASLPVVAARAGGIPEVVSAGKTGLLCESGSIDDLCQALTRLLESSDLRESMGNAGKERVRNIFSVERMTQRFQGLYQRCC
jgi:glycosyltransferase involved in cell wall biosynthesis